MALFTVEELACYVQRDIRRSTAELVLSLVEDAIYGVLGARLTDPPQRGVKGIALEVAKRALLNPANVQSEAAGGTSVTYNTAGTSRGVDLTDREIAKLKELVGAAYTSNYQIDLDDPGLGVRIDMPDNAFTPPYRVGWP